MAKLKVGVIGLGGAGRAHVNRLNRNPHVEKVYGYDIKKITGLSGVTIVKSREDLLSKVDAVTICTPDGQHFDDIVASLKANKHVLTEKPMTATSKEAQLLAPYIKKNSHLIFGVHHQMRNNPAFKIAKEIIQKNKLGKIFYIEANYWHDMRVRANKFDTWREKQGQSLIFGHGCHPIDLLIFLLGQKPVDHTTFLSKNSFREYNAKYTSATSVLKFPGNIVGKVHINSSCVYPQLNDIVILGEKGSYIDGVLYTNKDGFKQIADFIGDSNWFNTEMIIAKIGLPKPVLSFAINLYFRTLNLLSKFYLRLGSTMSLRFMKEAEFGFRRNPLTIYNHDFACQKTIDNFINTILGKDSINASYADADVVIRLCEQLEKEGLKTLK